MSSVPFHHYSLIQTGYPGHLIDASHLYHPIHDYAYHATDFNGVTRLWSSIEHRANHFRLSLYGLTELANTDLCSVCYIWSDIVEFYVNLMGYDGYRYVYSKLQQHTEGEIDQLIQVYRDGYLSRLDHDPKFDEAIKDHVGLIMVTEHYIPEYVGTSNTIGYLGILLYKLVEWAST